MSVIAIKDASNATVNAKALGTGSSGDPYRPLHGIQDGDDVCLGALNDSAVAGGAVGSISAKLRRLTTDLSVLQAAIGVATTQAPGDVGDDAALIGQAKGIAVSVDAISTKTDTLNARQAPSGWLIDENGNRAVIQRRQIYLGSGLQWLVSRIAGKRIRILQIIAMLGDTTTDGDSGNVLGVTGDSIGENYYRLLQIKLGTADPGKSGTWNSGFNPHGLLPEYTGEGYLVQPDLDNGSFPINIQVVYAVFDGSSDASYPQGRAQIDDFNVTHGSHTVVGTIEREYGQTGAAVVNLRTVDSSAHAGTDFTGIDQNITLPNGAATVSFNLVMLSGSQAGRSFYLLLTPVSGGIATKSEVSGVNDCQVNIT